MSAGHGHASHHDVLANQVRLLHGADTVTPVDELGMALTTIAYSITAAMASRSTKLGQLRSLVRESASLQ
jgi:hypothetical protein